MHMADAQVEVALKATHGKLKQDLNQAKNSVQKFRDQATTAFQAIGPAIAGAFAVTKIISFVQSGIAEFAKFDRSLDTIVSKLDRLGQGFDGAKEQVDGYVRGIEDATRFSKGEAAEALDNLILKTGDYKTALGLQERAMDLAVAANIPLKQSADMLALAYQGNTSGMSQLARVMGMTREQAKDVKSVFATLEEQTKGLARGEQGLQTDMDRLNHSLGDASEVLGQAIGPSLVWLANTAIPYASTAIQGLVNAGQSLGTILGAVFLGIVAGFTLIVDSARAAATFLVDVWTSPIQATKNAATEMGNAYENFTNNLKNAATATEGQLAEIWQEGADERSDISDDELEKYRSNLEAQTAIAETEEEKRTQTALTKGNKRLADEAREINRSKQLNSSKYAWISALYKNQADDHSEMIRSMELDFDILLNMTEQTFSSISAAVNGFADEGKMTMREFLIAIIEALVSAASTTIMTYAHMWGMKMAATAGNWVSAIVKYAAALAVGAAASAGVHVLGRSAVSSIRARMAEGGIVLGPTVAMIGEGEGPEAVIPLDRAEEFGFGGGGIDLSGSTWNLVFPDVSDAQDVNTGWFRMSAQRQLSSAMQSVRDRRGGSL